MRIGLLGGSFNPAHEGHRSISLAAMKRLGLDQVWWLVTPGNPLKDISGLPSVAERVVQARAVARHSRIVVTDLEAQQNLIYTIDTVRFLRRRFPHTHFVWLMGADNLVQFHRWREWRALFGLIPIVVLDRPGWRLKARASRAARAFAEAYRDEADARDLLGQKPPAWTFLTVPLSAISSTRLRQAAASAGKKRAGAFAPKKR